MTKYPREGSQGEIIEGFSNQTKKASMQQEDIINSTYKKNAH